MRIRFLITDQWWLSEHKTGGRGVGVDPFFGVGLDGDITPLWSAQYFLAKK